MEVEEFKRILEIGLGRSILYLQTHDAAPYRDVILNACLHNTSYDPQVEGNRTEYMMDVIDLTGEKQVFRDRILEALANLTDEESTWDDLQLVDFARLFAQKGDQKARQILNTQFVANVQQGSSLGADELIDLDGLQGFLFVAEKLGEKALSDPDFIDDDRYLCYVEQHFGTEEVKSALNSARKRNPGIRAYLKVILDTRKRRGLNRRKQYEEREIFSKLPYDEVKRQIDSLDAPKTILGSNLRGWGQDANDAELLKAARGFLALPRSDIHGILAYLEIFWLKPFPLEPSRLIELAKEIGEKRIRGEDGTLDYEARIFYFAMHNLELISNIRVREFALSLIESERSIGRAVALLANNYQDGDWQRIEELTLRPLEKENYHSLGFSVQDVFEAHANKEAVPALLNVYERGPCSTCRRRIVEALISLEALPNWMREECKYDANLDLREAARRNFAEEKS